MCAADDISDDDGGETTCSGVVVATDEFGIVEGTDAVDRSIKGTVDELEFAEETVDEF